MTGDAQPDPALGDLERELYWAEDVTPRANMTTAEIRVALHEFAAVMRADERAAIPRDEPQLGSMSKWRRGLKAQLFSFLRPIGHRYDRLLGDLAVLTRTLADRLADAEAEVDRLRRMLEERDGKGS